MVIFVYHEFVNLATDQRQLADVVIVAGGRVGGPGADHEDGADN